MSSPVSRPRAALSSARVVETAIDLADDAREPPTMRRLAESLEVTPMALYKHLANREQLIDAMVDRVVADIPPPSEADGWRPVLRSRILSARGVMRRHAWAQAAIESRTAASPVVLAYMDGLMAIMFSGGLSADLVHHAMHALSTRMWGFTRDVLPMPPTPDDPAERARALAAFAERYPAIIRMATTAPHADAGCDADAEFAFALDLILDGIERLHESGWASTRGASQPIA
ncbi:MAG TPA: TetR/AcrR family transcriptional regulator C-terminal domain-containing protein [Arachnia sp.]|jgi:AcrR family transcriptional regulator|nr:TetR/AcrR family transcriptional regulator C-terminal domain-containing protein [Arachnia sp.]